MKYPVYTEYESVYKRYFLKGTDYIINKVDINKNDKVLDLCGGNGRLTRELIKYSDDVSYLDKEQDMIPSWVSDKGIRVYNEDIKEFIKHNDIKFDKVFCMQGVNYYLDDIDMELFVRIFNEGGVFVFNTFNNKPSITPYVKEYSLDNESYVEISYLVNDEVYHVQIKENHLPHFTRFKYISRDRYFTLLSKCFDIEVYEDKGSSVYVCIRK